MKLFSRYIVTPEGVRSGTLTWRDGRIVSLEPGHSDGAFDAGRYWVLPGQVDTHVHCNDPGRTEWEAFAPATRAAASGGVTTIVDMPLNSVPATTSLAGLRAKEAAASGRCFVDYGFWGGLVPGNTADLHELAEAGVLGFKAFLVDSGVPEFPAASEADIRLALPLLAQARLPLLVHAEWPLALQPAPTSFRNYSAWLRSRPQASESLAVAWLAALAAEFSAPIHIVHVSAAEALRTRWPISAETCPHYLHFAAEDIPDGATLLKCAPPIRESSHREALWAGLREGRLRLIASDHSPSSPDRKALDDGDFGRAWGGVASLGLTLPVVWTGARRRGFELAEVCDWLCAGPAELAGLTGRKGKIAAGYDADFALFDAEEEWTVQPQDLYFLHAVSPYVGERLTGRVLRTYLRGEVVYDEGRFPAPARGEQLRGRCTVLR